PDETHTEASRRQRCGAGRDAANGEKDHAEQRGYREQRVCKDLARDRVLHWISPILSCETSVPARTMSPDLQAVAGCSKQKRSVNRVGLVVGELRLNGPEEAYPKPILICGLGRLGQHCALVLKELGIPVFALHDEEPKWWASEHLPQLLDRFTVGDCRRHSALEAAGIASCRAVLLTTHDERVNLSAALAARSLNPGVRVVIRSSQTNLN